MYIDSYLPFLEKAPFLRREVKEIKTEDLFFPIEVKNFGDINDNSTQSEEYMLSEKPKVYHVKPLDILVMDRPLRAVKWYRENMNELEVNITYVDYHKVVRFVDIEEGNENLVQAFYPENNGFLVERLKDGRYINFAKNRLSVKGENSLTESNGMIEDLERELIDIAEALDLDSELVKREQGGEDVPSPDIDVSGEDNKVEASINAYLTGDYVTERVPLLAGPTAVLKSATVKKLAKKNGYRMVDLRAAFMSRLDLEGLMERVEVDGNVESFNAAMYKLIEVTDDFLNFCESAIPRIKGKLENAKNSEAPQSDIEEMENMLEYYQKRAKPAVLFFDEVTRADKPVLNALTTILNQKEFLGYEVTQSKIVCATNLPIGLPDELRRVYGDVDVADIAIADRFETIRIHPDDVVGKWTSWAESQNENGEQNIHKVITGFLEVNKDYKYDFGDVVETYKDTGDRSKLYTTAFPNYRTWELCTNYIRKREGQGKVLNKDTIEGLIGENVIDDFVIHLESEGYEIEESDPINEMDTVVEEGMATNTPTMLVGPSSIGKTTRVKNVASEYGVRPENFITINLAQKDAIDIMGPPTKVDLASYVGGHGMAGGDADNLFGVESGIGRELKDLVKESPLPEKVTIKAPKTDLASKVRNAMKNNEPMVIFFDEFNRVEDDSVMTAIFEAVSDCFVGDTEIKMLDGTTKTIKEIHDSIQSGKEDIWVYSCTDEGEIKPGRVSASRKIETDKKLVRITLDNGKEEICTEDHKWMLRDGSYIEAGDLEEGVSLMPLYNKISSKNDGDYIDGYDMVWSNKDKEWKMTHKVVAKDIGKYQYGNVIHHSDFNKLNNIPENLDCSMDRNEHIEFHGNHLEEMKKKTDFEERRLEGFYKALEDPEIQEKMIGHLHKANTSESNKKSAETRKRLCEESEEYRKSLAQGLIKFNKETAEDGRKSEWMKEFHKEHPEVAEKFNKIGIEAVREYWSNEENREKRSKRYQEKYKDDEEFKERMRQNAIKNNRDEEIKFKQQLGKINKIVYSCLDKYGYIDELVYEKERKNICVNFPSYKTAMDYVSKTEYNELKEVADKYNHKVVSVEYLDRNELVYDITVDDYHNFALESGVFIHNCRIFGVDFDPELVTIFCAANIGREYRGAEDFDPAFAARFNVYRRDGYNINDVKSFKNYMEDNDFNPYIQEYINNMEEEEVLDMISQIDYRTLENSVPSLRSFTDLNNFLNDDSEETKKFNGSILFSDDKVLNIYQDIATLAGDGLAREAGNIKELTEKIKEKILNWSVLYTDMEVEIFDQQASPEDLVESINELYNSLFIQNPNTNFDDPDKIRKLGMLRDIIVAMFDMDNKLAGLRKDVIEQKIGDEAEDFVGYYNTVSGTDAVTVEIPDLKDSSLIATFFSQKLSSVSDQDDKLNMIVNYYTEFYDEFGDSLSQNHYKTFVIESLDSLMNSDKVVTVLKKVGRDKESADKVLALAENEDKSFVTNILNKAGLRVTDEEIDNAKEKSKYQGPEPKMLGN